MKVIALIATLLFLTTTSTQAQVTINEVFPAPEQEGEWIELFNSLNQEIDLNNWLLEDQLSSPSIIAHIQNQTLPPLSFLVIELSSAKLNNSGDGVVLKNSQSEIIDQMSYQSSEVGLSWAKNTDGIFELAQPTKNTTNVLSSPPPTPTNTSFHHLVTITEFLACPIAGEKEWVKLHNADSQPHSISSWKVRDVSNQTRQLDAVLMANDDRIISWSGSLLNNAGDEFELENELGESWQSIKYNACQSNNIFTKVDEQWVETFTTKDPTADKETGEPNSTPTDKMPSPIPLIPPNPPPPPHSAQQPILNYDLESHSKKSRMTNIVTKKLPKEALLGVILGGSYLLFSSIWKIHEKIHQRRSTT